MKNLLCKESLSAFGFSPATISYVKENGAVLHHLSDQEAEALVEQLVDKVIVSLCGANQFYHFDSFDRAALRKLYLNLLTELKRLPAQEMELELLARRHYRALQAWLKRSNPFVKSLYAATQPYLAQEVVCGEYSAQVQLQLLGIETASLQEPILDLGCGKQAFLVKHLRMLGLEA